MENNGRYTLFLSAFIAVWNLSDSSTWFWLSYIMQNPLAWTTFNGNVSQNLSRLLELEAVQARRW